MCPDSSLSALERSPGLPAQLRAHRGAAGLTVRELAEKAGIDKGTVSAWENAAPDHRFNVLKLRAVAKELGTSAEVLLGVAKPEKSSGPVVAEPSHLELVRRLADLQPLLDQIPELADLVEEARRVSGRAGAVSRHRRQVS